MDEEFILHGVLLSLGVRGTLGFRRSQRGWGRCWPIRDLLCLVEGSQPSQISSAESLGWR